MEPFIRNDQYNFIRRQAQKLVNGHSTVADQSVLKALESLVLEQVMSRFGKLTDEQKWLLDPIVNIQDKEEAERFMAHLKPYLIPFDELTDNTVKKLFPKAKKLKVPAMLKTDLREFSYIGWDDVGSQRRYLILQKDGRLVGVSGNFGSNSKKGICAFCHNYTETGLFLSETKGSSQEAFVKRGNYICRDSRTCNRNLTTLERIEDFVERLNR
ncbi:FusB/FusC family EF-G-binding protein [Indiicoccus explosivorum]|uniref:FusB/FusC family EF-G-binding protein n=1 Tax=Indiicoccus explosivorum TaxID=1917864 RepID=UPI000B4544E3|nr:FusB/FusC family EF-G-binding protein [Indiicoccus explosivorum]